MCSFGSKPFNLWVRKERGNDDFWRYCYKNDTELNSLNSDDKNFFESIPPSRIGSVRISLCIPEEKNFTARRGNLIYSPKIFWVPWIRWSACLHPGGRVLAGRPTDSRDLKCRGRVYPQRDISLSRWQGDEENFSLRVDPPLPFCGKLLYIKYKLRGIIWLNE